MITQVYTGKKNLQKKMSTSKWTPLLQVKNWVCDLILCSTNCYMTSYFVQPIGIVGYMTSYFVQTIGKLGVYDLIVCSTIQEQQIYMTSYFVQPIGITQVYVTSYYVQPIGITYVTSYFVQPIGKLGLCDVILFQQI